jgi:alkylated DNA repair dioxygenase AlkB
MTRDLFVDDTAPQPIPLRDADLEYVAALALPGTEAEFLRRLIDTIPWRSEKIVVWGKTHVQPRLIAWFGDPGSEYAYSGVQLQPRAWTPVLMDIRREVERISGVTFNSVLLNYYRDQNDSMGFHSDDEPELGPQPTIASVSFGERRNFVLKHKTHKYIKPVCLPLDSGSLLLMRGDTQRYWKHGIAKETRPCGPRVNLTFRRIVPRATPVSTHART